MYQWTDAEVSQLVKLAWQTASSNKVMATLGGRQQLADAIAEQIAATGWIWSRGRWRGGQAVARTADADWLPAVSDGVQWCQRAESAYASLLDARGYSEPHVRQRLGRMCTVAAHGVREMQDLFSLAGGALRGETCLEIPHRLVWMAIDDCQRIECVEFLRQPSEAEFGTREESIVRTLLECSLAGCVQSEPAPAGIAEQPSQLSVAGLESLPKRQREVLTLLSRGESNKEIARTLGISCHTVNDYTKALYRRFGVSGRNELLAQLIPDSVLQQVGG
jgi:DNA-binding CsgD family transcriptional regulator